MKRNRLISILLAVALLSGMTVGAVEGEETPPSTADPATPKVPEITVVGVKVNGAEETYFELGIEVSAEQFQSVGVVLAYDTGVLQPVNWKADGEPVTVRGTSWDLPTVLPSKGADNLAGKPALMYTPVPEEGEEQPVHQMGYIYLGADALQYTTLTDTRVVTVRFRYLNNYQFDDLKMPTAEALAAGVTKFTIDLAPTDIAQKAIPHAQVFASVGGDGVEPNYYAVGGDEEEAYPACPVTFQLGPGDSAGAGPAVSGGDYAITFFDWDGRVIDAISAPETVSADMQALIGNIEAKLQGSKRGYAFNGWLVVYQTDDGNGLQPRYKSLTSVKEAESIPVAYDTTPSAVNNAKLYTQDMFSHYSSLKDITTKTFEDLDNAANGSETVVLLQATYKTAVGVNNDDTKLNDGMSILDDNARYKFSDPTFYQYGKTTSEEYGFYAIRVDVSRDSTLRADKPTVQAEVFVEGSSYAVTVKVDLENTDETSFEVVVPKTVKSVAYRVLDTYGKDNWINGTSRSLVVTDKCLKDTIIKEGAFATIVDEARSGLITDTVNSAVNKLCFDNAGFTGVTEANLNTVTANLASESTRLGRALTRTEVQSVITSGHA